MMLLQQGCAMFFRVDDNFARRADRVLDILNIFNAKDAIIAHAERVFYASHEDDEMLHHDHAARLTDIIGAADSQSMSGQDNLPASLACNASCLEEALCVLAAAIRDGVVYAQASPDWRRPFLDTLPRDGSFRCAEAHHDEEKPIPSSGDYLALDNGLSLRVEGNKHWIVSEDGDLCGPGRTALRITPQEHAGHGYGAIHCVAERLLNIGDPRTQPSLTIGGYKSRSRAWDLAREQAILLGLKASDKGLVPDFEQLELVLNEISSDELDMGQFFS